MLNLVWCESFTQIWIQNSSLNLTDAWYFIIHIFLLDKIWSLIVDIFGLSLVSFVCQLSCFSDIINNLTVTHRLLEDRDHISCTSFGEGWVFLIFLKISNANRKICSLLSNMGSYKFANVRDIGSVEYNLQLLGTWREQEPIKVDTFD